MPLPKLFPQMLAFSLVRSSRKHEISFIRSTRQREATRVPFRIGFDRIDQSEVTKLAGFEVKTSWLFKMECHCSSGDFLFSSQYWNILLIVHSLRFARAVSYAALLLPLLKSL